VASSKRERELARRRVERQAARRAAAEAARRRRRTVLLKSLAALAALAVAVTVVALNYDGSKTAAKGDCTYNATTDAAAKKVSGKPPTKDVQRTGTKAATLETNRGKITLSLFADKAPCTVNSFAFLAAQKYFDGTSCHRVTQGALAVLQCGDPSGSGSGGPGYQFGEENLTGATYPKGTVAMARTATPGTNGSQFFLVYADSTLDPDYTPFGVITSGLDILAEVGKAGPRSATDTNPKLPVTLTKVTVT
jgi:cyclophilin family peptidyl-prolyl cis-trans isomerase